MSTTAHSAWWTLDFGDHFVLAETDGMRFVGNLQRMLRSALNTPLADWTGANISASDIGIDGRVGRETLRGTWAILSQNNPPPGALDAIVAAANAQQLDRLSIGALAWVASLLAGQPMAGVLVIGISADVIPPGWQALPPGAYDASSVPTTVADFRTLTPAETGTSGTVQESVNVGAASQTGGSATTGDAGGSTSGGSSAQTSLDTSSFVVSPEIGTGIESTGGMSTGAKFAVAGIAVLAVGAIVAAVVVGDPRSASSSRPRSTRSRRSKSSRRSRKKTRSHAARSHR